MSTVLSPRLIFVLAVASCLAPTCPAFGFDSPLKPALPKDLREEVDRTIELGVAYIDSTQAKDGTFRGPHYGSHPIGETALSVLALCSTGRGIEHRSVRAGMDAMRKLWNDGGVREKRSRPGGTSNRPGGRRGAGRGENVSTYEVALSLMAAVEAYAVGGSIDPASVSSVERRKMRPLPSDVREWIQDMADWLDEKKTRLSSREVAWRYPTGGYDHSCSQYAVLGLRAALQAGATVDRDVFADALRHFVSAQDKKGPEVRRRVDVDDGTGRYAKQSYVGGKVDHARGFGYTKNATSTPAMTAGGVSSLVICRDACRKGGRLDAELANRASEGIMDGLAWLGTHFEKEGNPRNGNLYYVYGLERAAVLAGVRTVGGHDWYEEGARAIVSFPAPDGCIGSLVDTCFAILFLTRSTDPDSPARKNRPATPSSDSLLDLAAAAKLRDSEFAPIFERAFDAWRRGRQGTPSEPGARAYSNDDMALFGPRGWRALVMKLDSDDDALRGDAFALLSRLAGTTNGYHPSASRETRLRGIAEWMSFTDRATANAISNTDVPDGERSSLESARQRK